MKIAFAFLIIAVLLLHQDVWFWTDRTLVFGILPIGMVYHAGYVLLAMLTMTLLVRFLWPAHLEEEANRPYTTEATET